MTLNKKFKEADEVISVLMLGLYSNQVHETFATLRSEAIEGIENIELPKEFVQNYLDTIDDEVAECEAYNEYGFAP